MKKEKLMQLRKEKGYTQQQMADVIATDVSNYNRRESGEVKMLRREWDKIARFLDVPVMEIYEGDIITKPIPVKNEAFYIRTIDNLNAYIKLQNEEIERLKKK
ncbi:helix-turn-helix transcriptional regulator [Chryseobacterium sp. RP-3-3]|uniref:Helix-turn-helix transcriptional regulator n=1 Tax=Chryseobacterium antibioticum TaxID=2728847 RepID=A0A7Y0FRD5_9FLAO|nr:helix-turn-helix transcriptional regulator [Chryseobacterium antibioticum]NML70018.1 helix-turn-helix transcriptional regulator [Chryseobacterium antibioticum]